MTWDKYFLNLAKEISKKSIDPHHRCGCIAVSEEHSILSTGYNGPPRNVDDTQIILTRPAKYVFMEHSERNCIYNAARRGIELNNCIFYVTGYPCRDCLRAMYQVGAKEVVFPEVKSHSYNDEDEILMNFLSRYINIRVINEDNTND